MRHKRRWDGRGLWKTPLQLHAQLQRAALSPQWKPFGASRTRNAGGLPTPETAPPPGEVASPPGEVAPPTAEAASPKAEAASPKAEAASLAAEEAAHANRPHHCRMRPIRRNVRLCECFTGNIRSVGRGYSSSSTASSSRYFSSISSSAYESASFSAIMKFGASPT